MSDRKPADVSRQKERLTVVVDDITDVLDI